MLSIEHLSFNYQDKPSIISNLSSTYDAGDIVAVKGPSGAGKTTLLYLICGVIPNVFKGDKTGRILYKGIDLTPYKLQEISVYISMLMQQPDYQLFFPVVEQELAFAPENLKDDPTVIKEKIDSALKTLGIENLRNSQSHTLSFGQKKMVALASILTLDPAIYLFDEPTAGLSNHFISKISDLIDDLSEKGKIIFIADHNSILLEKANKEIQLEG